MTSIFPLLSAATLLLAQPQVRPRTVWRQVTPPTSGAAARPAARRAAPAKPQPLGGRIDDPLPADYVRRGGALPGPVLKPPRQAEPDEPAGDTPLRDVTAGLQDVIGPVTPAAATKPAERARAGDEERDREGSSEKDHRAGSEDAATESDDPLRFRKREMRTEPPPAGSADGPAFPELSQQPHDRAGRRSKPDSPPQKPSSRKTGEAAARPPNRSGETTAKRVDHDDDTSASSRPPPATEPAAAPPAGTLVGLFASLAANVFLLWVAASQRSRYRALLRRTFARDLPADDGERYEDHDGLPHWEAIEDSAP